MLLRIVSSDFIRCLARVLVGALLFAPAALSAATAVPPPASEAERWLRHEAAGASELDFEVYPDDAGKIGLAWDGKYAASRDPATIQRILGCLRCSGSPFGSHIPFPQDASFGSTILVTIIPKAGGGPRAEGLVLGLGQVRGHYRMIRNMGQAEFTVLTIRKRDLPPFLRLLRSLVAESRSKNSKVKILDHGTAS